MTMYIEQERPDLLQLVYNTYILHSKRNTVRDIDLNDKVLYALTIQCDSVIILMSYKYCIY